MPLLAYPGALRLPERDPLLDEEEDEDDLNGHDHEEEGDDLEGEGDEGLEVDDSAVEVRAVDYRDVAPGRFRRMRGRRKKKQEGTDST